MFIIIKDNYRYLYQSLADKYKYKGINIYLNNNTYYISLANDWFFDDGSKLKMLKEKQYRINTEDIYYQLYIYVYKNEDNFNIFQLYENHNLVISDNSSSIINLDNYMKDKYLKIEDGIIETNYPISVNHSHYTNRQLNDGDYIYFLGIIIVYFKKFLFINNFKNDIKLKKYNFKQLQIKYPSNKIKESYISNEYILPLEINKAKSFIRPQQYKQDIAKTIIPNISMSIMMSLMAILNYLNLTNKTNLSLTIYLLTPLMMLLSGTIIPIIIYLIEKNKYHKLYLSKKEEYLSYLNKYHEDVKYKIDNYIKENQKRYFNIDDIFHYLSNKHPDFLTLSLGFITISNNIYLDEDEDKQINDEIKKINETINVIDKFPCLLDLKENKRVTIISKISLKNYLIKRFILELCGKHHFNDLGIGIFTYEEDLEYFYNIKHLFIDDFRLTISNPYQLQHIDQKKYNKPIIMFISRNCHYNFSNPNIIVVYFSEDNDDIYKDSQTIIEYYNRYGIIKNNNIIQFDYYIDNLNYDKYYYLLSKDNHLNNKDDVISFYNLYKDFNILESYKKNHHNLLADFAYLDSEIISLDIHEKYQGPHGLIGGTTGSGKSELIISLLLALCIRYSPEYLNIVLIDYKGSGIYESLNVSGRVIPHIIANVSNLENNNFERLIIALKHECENRQKLFKQLSQDINISIMDLDDYLSNHHLGSSYKKIAHLLIVVDEFAELKKSQPILIKELISISRIGRSLGIHLILSTQKPAGNIDDEIFSNSHFKIALRVFEERDSIDLIKQNDATSLTKAGQFYLKVDNYMLKAQSIYCKNSINNKEPLEIELLDETLQLINNKKIIYSDIESEINYFCLKILDTCDYLDINIKQLDYLPPLKMNRHFLDVSSLCFGQIDDYLYFKDGLVKYHYDDNLLICSDYSYINNVVNNLFELNRKCILISNKKYQSPIVSDYLTYENQEDILYLFSKLEKDNLAITVLIEDINVLLSYDNNYLDYLAKLIKRSELMSFSFICFSKSSQLPYRFLNLIKNKVMINNNNQDDISYFFSSKSEYKGSSYYYDEKVISFVACKKEELIEDIPIYDNIIEVIPRIIKKEIIEDKILIGYNCLNRNKVFCDKDIKVYSYNIDLLNIYKSAYTCIDINLYNNSTNTNIDNYLWLGPGFVNSQFSYYLKNDLSNDEGLFFENGKVERIKILNA